MNWEKLNNVEQLEQIVAESKTQPVAIFKHSTRCSISATALDRFERKGTQNASSKIKFYYLDLLNHRDISNKIAQEFGVEHESPQLIVLKNGEAVYHASHYDISYDELPAVS